MQHFHAHKYDSDSFSLLAVNLILFLNSAWLLALSGAVRN